MNDLSQVMHPSWAKALSPVADQIHDMGQFLREENKAGRGYLPKGENIFRAFQTPLNSVRVLIVGQDPYPTPGHPVGLSFSVARDVRPLPRSLKNIYKELHDDLQIKPAEHGDLTSWTDSGIMLLNRVLTVSPGMPASHQGKGWEAITDLAIRRLAERGVPLVAILWGRQARDLRRFMPQVPAIESAHPSPLSASRGFFGSRPFSRANALLVEQGGEPVDWTIR